MVTKVHSSFAIRLVIIFTLVIGLWGIQPPRPVHATILMVTNTDDSGPGSLRQAIADAASGDTIHFDSSLNPVIDLFSPLIIDKDLTIDGSGWSNQSYIFLRGMGNIQILNSTVEISNLTISGGSSNGDGGAIWSNGNLRLVNSTIMDSHAVGNGGGIYSSGPLTVQSSALYGNTASLNGGGIYGETSGQQLQVANSTIAENYAQQYGGGIFINGNTILSVVNTTIAQNAAGTISQIKSEGQSEVTFVNSIAACWFPRIFTDCYNFVRAPSITSSILGTKGASYGLMDLADNGGPTKTMSLYANSPLVDAGDDAVCESSFINNVDQRGMARPYGSHCDIGAHELSYVTISGNVGIGGATIEYTYRLFTLADNNGNYLIKVLPNWSGTVIPSKSGYSFTPAKRVYTAVQNDQTTQSYDVAANTFVDSHNSGETWRVSIPNGGGESDDDSYGPSISADGRYVTYWSFALNLVAGDGANDIVLYDNQTGQTSAISVDSNGIPLDCNSYAPSISADGRYVAFLSCAGGGGVDWIVYVYDRHTGILDFVGRGMNPSISADGRYIAYESTDNDNNQFRIFVNDRLTSQDIQVSISPAGDPPDGDSFLPSISADGRYVAFHSLATDLVDNDTNGVGDVFVYDLQTNEMTRVSVNSNGVQANGGSLTPSISLDGRFVAFHSAASNLVENDTNGVDDVFVHDLQTGETTRVSISSSGTQGNLSSNQARIFANGRFVAFRSFATNLISGDTNNGADIFTYDRQTGQTRRVSIASNGAQANGNSPASYSSYFSISEDGKHLAFSSDATNLVTADTNGYSDIFVHQTLGSTNFNDVPIEYWAWDFIERLYSARITGGCGTDPLRYCPANAVTRAQMAVFLERGIHGSSYSPPAVGGGTGFGDVKPTHWAAAWIKQLATEGITAGCGSGNYCPEMSVTRAQMAVFLLRAKYGSSYSPPPVGGGTGFGDVQSTYWAAAWIKQLVAEGITAGCGSGNYCPDTPVTRAQMAVFLVKTFKLP